MPVATTARTQTPRLAAAFLALSDGDEPEPRRRSPLAALTMAMLLALAAPMAWLSEPVVKPTSVPLAMPASKATVPAPGDDAGDA